MADVNPNTAQASSNPTGKIYQQIEQDAGFYAPSVYELLTFYSAWESQPEELDGQFIPLTATKPRIASQTKIFAVGVLPPSSNVTGRLLDRSASVAASGIAPASDARLVATAGGNTGNSMGQGGRFVAGNPGDDKGPPIMNQLSTKQAATALRDAWAQRFGSQPSADTLALLVSHSNRETGLNTPNYNYGFITSLPGQQSFGWQQGGGVRYYRSYDSAQDGANGFLTQVIASGGLDAAKSGDVQAYSQALFDHNYYGTDPNIKGYETPSSAVSSYAAGFGNQDFVKNQIGSVSGLDSNSLNTLQPTHSQLNGDGGNNGGWQSNGSANAQAANKNSSKTSGTDLNTTDLGLQFLAAQQGMINATLAALDRMARTPPLRLLVNPQSFRVSAEKIIADGNWGRNGPIIEHWGEQQDKIEASGKVAGFYALDTVGNSDGSANPGTSPGLGRTARQFSQSYQNLLSLWLLYKNNGGVWLDDAQFSPPQANSSKRTNLSVVGSIYLYYDDILYVGSFDSFNLVESETTPFSLEYNFTFSVRAWFLLDRIDDQTFTYGAPQFFQGTPTPPQVSPEDALFQAPTNNAQPSPDVPLPPAQAADNALQEQIINDFFATRGNQV